MRQLPRHERAARRLAEVVAPGRRHLQRLHTPANFLGKYATKASNGFWHSFYFTTGAFHEPIQIKKRNLEITDALRRRSNNNETRRVKSGRGFR